MSQYYDVREAKGKMFPKKQGEYCQYPRQKEGFLSERGVPDAVGEGSPSKRRNPDFLRGYCQYSLAVLNVVISALFLLSDERQHAAHVRHNLRLVARHRRPTVKRNSFTQLIASVSFVLAHSMTPMCLCLAWSIVAAIFQTKLRSHPKGFVQISLEIGPHPAKMAEMEIVKY